MAERERGLYEDDERYRAPGAPIAPVQGFDTQAVQDAYQRYLGRTASDSELASHYGNPGGATGAVNTISGSDEARAFASRPAAAPSSGGRRGWNNLNLDFGGQRNSAAFRGFNDERALAGGDPNSVKDAFRRFAGAQDGPQDTSKEGLDAWLTALLPQAREYGLNILDVIGDQMLVETNERGPEWIDYFQNAGGEDGAFQWLDQLSAGGAQPDAAFGDALGSLRGMPGGSDILTALMADGGLTGGTLLEQIQAELQKLLTGQAPSSPNAPLPQGLLQGGGDAPLF